MTVLAHSPFAIKNTCVLRLFFKDNIRAITDLSNEEIYNMEKIIVVVSGLLQYIEDKVVQSLTDIIKNNRPLYVIYDFSQEHTLQERDLNEIDSFFKNIGLDVDNRLLILNNKGLHDTASIKKKNTLTYDWLALDGLYWLKNAPEKFTSLELKKRPNLCNLIVSKLKTKSSRVYLIYEFWKRDLLKSCIFSTMGTIEEIRAVINDKNFLDEMEQRVTNIGGELAEFEEGRSNLEFACETSNRTIFNNSRLSCVHETAFFDFTGERRWKGHSQLTEKFYRCILNRTPFVVFGSPNTYQQIKNMGFDTFESIFDLDFDSTYNGLEKIDQYCEQVTKFLNTNPEKLDQLQEICEYNFQRFMNTAVQENKMYQERITKFLND